MSTLVECPVRRLTDGPQAHFFGYYEKCPWDSTGRYLLALRTSLPDDVMPGSNDEADVVLIDLHDGGGQRLVAKTRAWNWQQGCMLQWLLKPGGDLVLYNDRRGGRLVSVILDPRNGSERSLSRPVYSVSRCADLMLGLNFERLHRWRRVTGYASADGDGDGDPAIDHPAPASDGIWRIGPAGPARLVMSIADVVACAHDASMDGPGVGHWLEHVTPNPSARRLVFLHRWVPAGARSFRTRMFTVSIDGSDLFLLSDEGMVSHFDWQDDHRLLAWSRRGGHEGYFLYTDRTDGAEPFAEGVLTQDGHCSFSPDGRWLLTDTYPDARRMITLTLLRRSDGRRFDVGRFYSPPQLKGDVRCDLHPRWGRDGREVCIDSAHEGRRQMYVVDVSGVEQL